MQLPPLYSNYLAAQIRDTIIRIKKLERQVYRLRIKRFLVIMARFLRRLTARSAAADLLLYTRLVAMANSSSSSSSSTRRMNHDSSQTFVLSI